MTRHMEQPPLMRMAMLRGIGWVGIVVGQFPLVLANGLDRVDCLRVGVGVDVGTAGNVDEWVGSRVQREGRATPGGWRGSGANASSNASG